MRASILTREYPPEVYGGAGVHVTFLAHELRKLIDVDVLCFGAERPDATSFRTPESLADANFSLQTLAVDLEMAAATSTADLVHSHTWYANMAGHFSKLLHDVPHVITAHSLEPRRPWKAEQLGGGYRVSSWAEKTAYEAADLVIAVSNGMREDVLDCYPNLDPAKLPVIYNGIDTERYFHDGAVDVLERYGVDQSRPYVIFVGRITRQKGVPHLLQAARAFDPEIQIVLCAGAPDTPELGAEVRSAVDHLTSTRSGVIWIEEMLPVEQVRQLLSHAAVFVCPSVYEPLGIVNLEAMACETAVVASAVGGIPEVVVDGTTGLLVPYDENRIAEFEAQLASGVNRVALDSALADQMGRAGRDRAVDDFGWDAVARQTVEAYQSVL
jgi:starch synthase